LIQDRISLVQATSGPAFGEIIDPICETSDKTYYHNNLPSPYRPTGFPAGVKSAFGSGKTTYFAADLAMQFARSGQPVLRELMANAVKTVARGRLPFTVKCPKTTEFLVHEDSAGRWICHFLSVHLQQPTWNGELAVARRCAIRTKEVYEETLPIFDVVLSAFRTVRKASLYPGGESLRIHGDQFGTTLISVPRIQLWESLILDFDS
jgi:hypothetical protein